MVRGWERGRLWGNGGLPPRGPSSTYCAGCLSAVLIFVFVLEEDAAVGAEAHELEDVERYNDANQDQT